MSDPQTKVAGIPKTIKVGPVIFTVRVDKDAWLSIEHETMTKGYYGHTRPQTGEIFLNPEHASDVHRLTLWHEVIHALLETVAGSPDWAPMPDDKKEREEMVVRELEAPTLTVLRDNPELVAYLVA